jgi:hypothetical protein
MYSLAVQTHKENNMKAADLKAGDKVMYLDDIPATVIRVEKNGIVVEYWGISPWNRDKCIRERVAIRTLSPREDYYK